MECRVDVTLVVRPASETSKMDGAFIEGIEVYLEEHFDGYLVPCDFQNDEYASFSRGTDGNIKIGFSYVQDDDGMGWEDVESFAGFILKSHPLPKELVSEVVEVFTESERTVHRRRRGLIQ